MGLRWVLLSPLLVPTCVLRSGTTHIQTQSKREKPINLSLVRAGTHKCGFCCHADKGQKVVNSMLHLRHFCYLSYKLFREKPKKRWTIALLRFLYLTISIFAGIECQDTKKERKTRICEKSQLAMASDLLAMASELLVRRAWRRVHGELTCHGE